MIIFYIVLASLALLVLENFSIKTKKKDKQNFLDLETLNKKINIARNISFIPISKYKSLEADLLEFATILLNNTSYSGLSLIFLGEQKQILRISKTDLKLETSNDLTATENSLITKDFQGQNTLILNGQPPIEGYVSNAAISKFNNTFIIIFNLGVIEQTELEKNFITIALNVFYLIYEKNNVEKLLSEDDQIKALSYKW